MNQITLSKAIPGETYTILKIANEKRLFNRISSMGLMTGGQIEICQNKKKQPVLIYARDTLIAIGRKESEKILVGGNKQ
ncbi:MAG: ferrous iron transport protein A [Eubacterium sp.]|nr:ferrous iron transport protein A [Eubacterium sp.]